MTGNRIWMTMEMYMLAKIGESAEPCPTPVDGTAKEGDSDFPQRKEEVREERY